MKQTALKGDKDSGSGVLTPMMRQYFAIKEEHPDYLLFYRMGDFYELFFDDAVVAAAALDIALTKRGKHQGQDIAMCGVPHHSHEAYLHKLIKKGHKVAICEQMEPPEEAKKRGSKSVVRREVTRIVTPGTITEDSLLDARSSNYLAAIAEAEGKVGLAWVDISTGEFTTSSTNNDSLPSEISRINPKELLLPERVMEGSVFMFSMVEWRHIFTPHVASFFDSIRAERKLKEFYKVKSLDSFGNFTKAEIGAAGSLIEYIELTQKGNIPRLSPPKKFVAQDFMVIDAATRKSLELSSTLSGEYKGSLLSVINKTITAAGSRLLASSLSSPLISPEAVNNRLDMVEFFCQEEALRGKLQNCLYNVPDIERCLSRICLYRAGPRDLLAIRNGLEESINTKKLLEGFAEKLPKGLKSLVKQLGYHSQLLESLNSALADEVPFMARDGGFIKKGFSDELDSARNARQESEEVRERLQEKYRIETGVDRLKISENNLIGLYIEITSQHAAKMPDYFIQRQGLAGSVRYTTPELRELENKIINAKDIALQIETQIFDALINQVIEIAESLSLSASALANLDMLSSFAALAKENGYNRPRVDASTEFNIKAGRHPVVELSLRAEREDFISNGCNLGEAQKLWLLTGPNMAGKSTFLRQNALIVLLAQMGSFVPAESAHIGAVDRLFSRVGAADDLARGRSTFMVEMVETATILNQATEKSFVILDEIGRGTATFDGLSIAWAVTEYMHNVKKCRTLFATHYHELTALSAKLASLACYSMKVKEWKGEVVFLHEVISGTADRSYGIHVAKLAGLPQDVIKRSEEILLTLEKGETTGVIAKLAEDLPLFLSSRPPEELKSELIAEIENISPDELSPKQALEALYKIKSLLE